MRKNVFWMGFRVLEMITLLTVLAVTACNLGDHGKTSDKAASSAESVIDKAKRDEISVISDDDPDMAKAFRKAQSTLDDFLAIAQSPAANIQSVAVKVPVQDKENTEYFWITPFTRENDNFKGRVSNNPRLVKNVALGQELSFDRSRIVDWMYIDAAKKRMFGNFSACALLKHEPAEKAEEFKKQLGLECDF